MTDPHEDLVEAGAKAIYENWGYAYEGRTVGPNGPYGNWAIAVRSARAVLALIAERTKDATPEMTKGYASDYEAELWTYMHARSTLWKQK